MDYTGEKKVIYDYLRQSRFFSKFSDEVLINILVLAQMKHFRAGEVVLTQGETNHSVYFILDGVASVRVDGKFIYFLARKGDIFGEMSVVTGEPCSATIEAHNDLDVIVISSSMLHSLEEEEDSHKLHYLFYRWFCQVFSDKLKLTSQKAKRFEDLNKALHEEIDARKSAEASVRASLEIVERQQDQMHQELEQAKETQGVLLPEKMPHIPEAQIVGKYVPMNQIGGDFYDVVSLPNNTYGLLVADVTGHGIPAALVSFMVASIFKNIASDATYPDEVLNQTNDMLYEKLPEGKFVTLFYVIYDANSHCLMYANAAHPPALVVRPDTQEVFQLDNGGLIIGQFTSDMAGYETSSFQLEPGDKLLLYTDGIIEVRNQENEFLDMDGVIHWLKTHCQLGIDDLLEQLYDFGVAFSRGQGFDDDITFVGLEVLAD